VNKGAAILIKDSQAQQALIPAVIELLKNETLQHSLSVKIKALAINDSAERIAAEVYKLVKHKI
jgi:UDP-N-acetylglucosamine--N-acetylmuramyl-(pentapeptide) pyrophosphoryl-undecaprenol N-acetylglucosamine transferase